MRTRFPLESKRPKEYWDYFNIDSIERVLSFFFVCFVLTALGMVWPLTNQIMPRNLAEVAVTLYFMHGNGLFLLVNIFVNIYMS